MKKGAGTKKFKFGKSVIRTDLRLTFVDGHTSKREVQGMGGERGVVPALLAEIDGRLSLEGFESLGFRADPRVAMYMNLSEYSRFL